MKKNYLMLLFCFLSFHTYAQLAEEDFEGSWMPNGWDSMNNGIGLGESWSQSNNTDAQPGYQSNYAAYINKENVTDGMVAEDYLVTPEFTMPEHGRLTFYSRLTSVDDQGSIYKVLIINPETSDDTQPSDYTELQTWTELEINPLQQTDYKEIVLNIPEEWNGQQVRIAFMMAGDEADRWLVDKVKVDQQCLNPYNLTVTNLGSTSAHLSWNNPSGASEWEIAVLPEYVTFNGTGQIYQGTLPYIAGATDGLIPSMCYKFYVRAMCNGESGSDWVGPIEFCTVKVGDNCYAPIEIVTLPYLDINNTANYADFYEGFPGTGCGNGGFEDYLTGNDVVYQFTSPVTGTLQIDLTNFMQTGGLFIYNDCEAIGYDCVAGGVGGISGENIYIKNFEVTEGDVYYIVISTWHPDGLFVGFQTTPYTLTIQQEFCPAPDNLSAEIIDMTTVNLSWSDTSASSWEVTVQPAGIGIPLSDGEYTTDINTNFTIPSAEDIIPLTDYEFYVRSDCGDGTYSTWSGPYAFETTICPVEDQCIYTFEMWFDGGGTWWENTMSVVQNGYTVATLTGPAIYTSVPVFVDVAICDGLPFELFWNAGGYLPEFVGVSVRNSFGQLIYTKPPNTGQQDSLLYSENVINCNVPLCSMPTGLSSSNSTLNSVELEWDSIPDGSWEYFVTEEGNPAPTTSSTVVATDLNNVTVNLEQATNYEFYVRQICDNAATAESPWAGPYRVSTAICPGENQCNFTFTMKSNLWAGWMGGTMTISQNGINVQTIGSSFTSGPIQEITVALCDGLPFEIFWNTGGTSSNQMGLTVTNSFGQTLFDLPFFSSNGVETGVGSILFEGTVDCQNPLCIAPSDLGASNPTPNSVQLGWDGPSSGEWEYFITQAGGEAPDDFTSGINTAVNPVTAILANPATYYDYYVRKYCPDFDGYSSWSGPYTFYSTVCEEDEKCVFFVELTSQLGLGYVGTTMTIFQEGIPAATVGSTFVSGAPDLYSQMIEVPLCPDAEIELVWNAVGGSLQGDKGITIYSPYMEEVYQLEAPDGLGLQGTTLFTGVVTCEPPACAKPQNLNATDITVDSVLLEWEEMGESATWEICVLPYASDVLPTASVTVATSSYNYGALAGELLMSGHPYKFYVRSVCEDGLFSTWSGPFKFATVLENNDCDGAITIPVNPGVECNVSITGTMTGATYSGVLPSCSILESDSDVWYSFTATDQTHLIGISNQIGTNVGYAVYEANDCNDMTEVFCHLVNNVFEPIGKISGLTPGQLYYIQAFELPPYHYLSDFTSFDLCIMTPATIVTDVSTYTINELVQDVFMFSPCLEISNISWNTGTDFGAANGIGYFEKGTSNFDIDKGIILSTGDAMKAPGPNLNYPLSDGVWPLDVQLMDYLNQFDPLTFWEFYTDATVLEFDFVASTNRIKFPFVFASEEYGYNQCMNLDAFAFFLTTNDGNGPVTANLAVVPGTDTYVSVGTIRDNAFNISYVSDEQCPPANQEYFGGYYGSSTTLNNPELAQSRFDTPLNFNGNTVKMLAEADVVEGQLYHVKLVISDMNGSGYDSAVFIGSFNPGIVNLGEDLTITDNNALCPGNELLIQSKLDPADYSFVWTHNGEIIEGADGPNLLVSEPGLYGIDAAFSPNCHAVDEIKVEMYLEEGEPIDLAACSSTGVATFDLSQNTTFLTEISPYQEEGIEVTYHVSSTDAEIGSEQLSILFENTTENLQTIYARIINNYTGCITVREFDLVVQDFIPQFNEVDDFALCEGSSGTIEVDGINFETTAASYSWKLNGIPQNSTSESISVVEAGIYEVEITNLGCTAVMQVVVTILPIPVADNPEDITTCVGYTLPELSEGNSYHSESGGAGTQFAEGDVISETQEVFVFAQSNTEPSCNSENSFIVTINPSDATITGFTFPAIICTDSVNPTPIFVEGYTVGGIFSSGDGLEINPNTGEIILSESTPGNYEITYAVTEDIENCINGGSTTISISIVQSQEVNINFNLEDSYCFDEKLAIPELQDGFTTGGTFTSDPGLVIDESTGIINIGASAPGHYLITYTVLPDAEVCSAGGTATDSINIEQERLYSIEYYCDDNQYILKVIGSDDISDLSDALFEWYTIEGELVADEAEFNVTEFVNSRNGDIAYPLGFTVTILNNGCSTIQSLSIHDIICFVPRGISPNNDGKNDNFDLTGFNIANINIFNRYGKEVYSRRNYTNQWYGQANDGSDLPTGTYFYSLERSNGENLTGWVYLNRED